MFFFLPQVLVKDYGWFPLAHFAIFTCTLKSFVGVTSCSKISRISPSLTVHFLLLVFLCFFNKIKYKKIILIAIWSLARLFLK
ncbi:hypothetical protein RchiOBHm_Chr4g0421241 [Rosa chinensis]|uniref:Uncharacterized protein n=1 Tax=Rosa chinensis TaxID=74649 RepID=A0A2P6QY40_ROSCH|nr:hypothetical protein RchiOBHm_Chr4g0421241 [Rosa chinensis]